jgi:hypothetical protein
MEIRKLDNTSFGTLTNTNNLFETILMRSIRNDGIEGARDVVYTLYPNMKFVGNRGYRYYAEQIGQKVKTNYPELAKDIAEINSHIKSNPKISKKELSQYAEPYIKKYGEKIDIEI